jgi:NADH:ubiquinone oxidoreductase subunit 6 (subunit J)
MQLLPSALAAAILFGILFKVIVLSPWGQAAFKEVPITIEDLGLALMTRYALPFEFMCVVLLAAMVGAIVIGKVDITGSRKYLTLTHTLHALPESNF